MNWFQWVLAGLVVVGILGGWVFLVMLLTGLWPKESDDE